MRCDRTFEYRALKYCTRGFALAVPGFDSNSTVDPDSVLMHLLNVATKSINLKPEDWIKELKLETSS